MHTRDEYIAVIETVIDDIHATGDDVLDAIAPLIREDCEGSHL